MSCGICLESGWPAGSTGVDTDRPRISSSDSGCGESESGEEASGETLSKPRNGWPKNSSQEMRLLGSFCSNCMILKER